MFLYTKGAIYNLLKDYNNAKIAWLEYAKTAVDKYTVYNALALNYIETNDFEEAEKYYNLILNSKNIKESDLYLGYLNYGIFAYEHKHDFQRSLHYFDLALESVLKYHSHNPSLLSKVYHNYGEVYLSENELTRSLDYFQKALIAGSIDFKTTDYLTNPSLNQITNLSRIYTTLNLKPVH